MISLYPKTIYGIKSSAVSERGEKNYNDELYFKCAPEFAICIRCGKKFVLFGDEPRRDHCMDCLKGMKTI